MTVDKVKFVSSQQFRKRQDEIFFRLKKEQLYSLYCEYEADEYEDIAENEISGCGPHIVTYTEDAKPNYEKPYLLLDIRDKEEFQDYRLLQSRSFPYVYLRQDRVHPELANFKNKEGHLIIVVSRDDRMGADAAKILVDRGADNVFLLSNPVSDFAEEYPAFAEGNVPAPKKSPSRTPSRTGGQRRCTFPSRLFVWVPVCCLSFSVSQVSGADHDFLLSPFSSFLHQDYLLPTMC